MRPLLQLHHVVCLASHAFACVPRATREGVPWYFAGVTSLEVGSGALSAFWLSHSRAALLGFFVVMTMSNLAGLACARRWARAVDSRAAASVALVVTISLCAIRQWESTKTLLREW